MAQLSSPTLGKLITNVRNMLNQPNPANSFWSDYELTEYINEGIRMYFSELVLHNEGHYVNVADLDIVSGVETVTLPSDFFEVRALYKKVSNGYEILNYVNSVTDGYSTQGGSSSNAYIPYYFFRDNDIVLRPTPNFTETASLRMEYIQLPDTLVNGGDQLSSAIAPVFKQIIEVYAVYKAKLKESMVNGVDMHSIAGNHLNQLYISFKETITNRSKYPQFVVPYNPEGVF